MRKTPSFFSVLRPGWVAWTLCAGASVLQAQPVSSPAPSHIASVKLYPGSATVERVARVASGSRSYTFTCLPAALDATSVQASAPASVRLGESTIDVQDRDIAGGCASALEERWKQAGDRVAHASARTQALELALGYLKAAAHGPAGPAPGSAVPTPSAAVLASTTEALRRQSEDTWVQLHQAQRRLEEAQLALKALESERERMAGAQARVASVTVTLATAQDAELRLIYQVRGPSWSPGYRASLDSASAKLRLERLALVAQSTGEDWSGVPLTLSTGAPHRQTSATLPRPWRLDVAPPVQMLAAAAPAPAPPAAAAPKMALRARALEVEAAEPLPSFDVQVSEGAYATEFTVPQRITVPSGGPRVTLALGQVEVQAELLTRAVPAQEEAAYLVAQFAAPAGVWPAAAVALYRDGAFVGNGRFDVEQLGQLGLAFGRDERVRVHAQAVREHQASAGFTGGSIERQWQRSYTVENVHGKAVLLQVLDSAPVSKNEAITVASTYQPLPTGRDWNQQAGTIVWQQSLAAGATVRLDAAHTIRYAKEVQVQERK